jgi:hypothetical protein
MLMTYNIKLYYKVQSWQRKTEYTDLSLPNNSKALSLNLSTTKKKKKIYIFVLFLYFRYIFTLYLMSDCYLGLDQQYDIYLNVTQASISTQVNTEVSDAFSDLWPKQAIWKKWSRVWLLSHSNKVELLDVYLHRINF